MGSVVPITTQIYHACLHVNTYVHMMWLCENYPFELTWCPLQLKMECISKTDKGSITRVALIWYWPIGYWPIFSHIGSGHIAAFTYSTYCHVLIISFELTTL